MNYVLCLNVMACGWVGLPKHVKGIFTGNLLRSGQPYIVLTCPRCRNPVVARKMEQLSNGDWAPPKGDRQRFQTRTVEAKMRGA